MTNVQSNRSRAGPHTGYSLQILIPSHNPRDAVPLCAFMAADLGIALWPSGFRYGALHCECSGPLKEA